MSVCIVIRKVEEAHALKAFGLRVAGALDETLELWLAHSEKAEEAWMAELKGMAIAKVRDLSGADRKRQVLIAAKEEWPRLLIVGKQVLASADDPDARFSIDIFEHVVCQVLAVRVSNDLAETGNRILVPCAGGRHSRRALKLAQSLSKSGTVAFQMRAATDDLSEDVGHFHLEKLIKKAGLSPANVLTRVRLGDSFGAELSAEMKEEDYGMLIVGANGAGTLRRKLFGTLPEGLIKENQGLTAGVIRAERSKGHRFRETVGG